MSPGLMCNACRRNTPEGRAKRHWCLRAVAELAICQCPGKHYR